MSIHNTKIFTFSATLLFCGLLLFKAEPVKAEITFNCYLCKALSEEKAVNFCIQAPAGQSIIQPTETLKEKFGNKYMIDCDPTNLAVGKCSKLGSSSSSICPNEPTTADQFNPEHVLITTNKTTSTTEITGETKSLAPNLNVPIPGVDFTETIDESGQSLLVPYLAQYISALQKYLIGIALVAAALMIIVGGVKYIIASTGAKVERSKEMIIDAIMGVAIVLGAYVILANINPNLTYLPSLQITKVERAAFNLSAPIVKAEVEQVSTPTTPTRMPILDLGGSTPVESQAEAPGQPVKDAKGNFVAQGKCPSGMIMIKNSPAYSAKTKITVKSFCIDKYEAPNIPGVKPYIAVTEPEADLWCNERGKRLCTVDEWQRACLGPEGKNTYGYGEEYIEGERKVQGSNLQIVKTNKPPAPCNYDSVGQSPYYTTQMEKDFHGLDQFTYFPLTPASSILTPDSITLKDPKLQAKYNTLQAAIEKYSAHEPSGSRINCKTEEGVYDMPANTQEIVLSNEGVKMTIEQRLEKGKAGASGQSKPYRWLGFYWSPAYHQAYGDKARPTCTIGAGTDHIVAWRGHENGFRCCLSVDD